jgi:hypothetical protein
MDSPSVEKGKRRKTISRGRKRADKRTCEYGTENNESDYGLESSGEKILLCLRRVLRSIEAALRERGNEDGAYSDLEKG